MGLLLALSLLNLGGCAQMLCELRTDRDPVDPYGDRRQCEAQVEQHMDERAAEKQKRLAREQQALLDEAIASRIER
ncbi:hypothetical protein [Shewanella sp. FJAT-52076]|uniref:hypothetical protein n=1 Tax=Shewanella sp. FJAT-52076 TaxID=2864202 RepID=UPI001C658325|nr:hypothetical protein [Shewanella sp. FJAT-52076]QYJ76002.1 hypothetical protein K0H79_03165 [Shewanella sp. FJAT-52076]